MDTKALRQKILDLAIRGKLVPQDPNDEPASVLLERIRAEKQQMVKEGKLKAKDIKGDTIIFKGGDNLHYEKFHDGTVKCIEDEIPFELPEGWEWCRFGSVVTLMSGTTYPVEKELLSGTRLYVKVGDMNLPGNEYEISTSSRYLDEYNISHLIPVNSVIFPKRGGAIATNKKKLVLRNEILIDLNTMAFTPISPVNLMYCYYWFLSIDLDKINSGSSVPQINNKDIEPLLFPVPPTFEQERIVQVIVPLLDAEQKISAAGVEVAQIICRAKSKILDLAIRGKLVPQDPNDEPASVLLERIRAEKEELIKQGKIKRDKKESIIFRGDDNSYYALIDGTQVNIAEHMGFELPDGWRWITLRDIAAITSGKTPKPDMLTTNGIIPYFKVSDMNTPGNELQMKFADYYINDLYAGPVFRSGSFIFPKNGGAVLTNKKRILENDSVVDLNTGVFTPSKLLNQDYVFFLFSSIDFSKIYKGAVIPTVDSSVIGNLIYGLPPLEEQIRIADTIKKLLTQLEQIEIALS